MSDEVRDEASKIADERDALRAAARDGVRAVRHQLLVEHVDGAAWRARGAGGVATPRNA